MSNPWFRMYHEFATDPKVQMLSEQDQRRFVMLLCLRCGNGDVTLHDAAVAFQLRIGNDAWAETKARLVGSGLIGEDNKPTSDLADKSSLRLPAAEWAKTRARIFARDDYTCRYCGARGVDLQCDHVIPVTRAGSNDDSNLVTSCRPCNAAKRDKIVSIEEWSRARRAAS